jgi:hypothetical protein
MRAATRVALKRSSLAAYPGLVIAPTRGGGGYPGSRRHLLYELVPGQRVQLEKFKVRWNAFHHFKMAFPFLRLLSGSYAANSSAVNLFVDIRCLFLFLKITQDKFETFL